MLTTSFFSRIESVTETYFINHYHCPNCDIEWDDTWDCACNDKCSGCNKEIEPEFSEEIELT